jgi:hypothetical protein
VSDCTAQRWLFSVVLLVGKSLFRRAKLVFCLFAVTNLSYPLQDKLFVRGQPTFDYKDVIQLVLDVDPALVRHVVFADDVNESLIENLERCPLRDDESILQRSVDQHVSGLTVT